MSKVSKISDKLTAVSDSMTVYFYDNGYMVEISGKDDNDGWPTAKIIANSYEELIALIKEAVTMPRN